MVRAPEWTEIVKLAFERQEPSSLMFSSGQYSGFLIAPVALRISGRSRHESLRRSTRFGVTCHCEGARGSGMKF